MAMETNVSLPPSIDASITARHRELLKSFETALEHETLAKAVLLAALHHRSDGVALIGIGGEIICLNGKARALLSEGDGLSFADGKFHTSRLPEAKRLQASVEGAFQASDQTKIRRVLVSRPSGKAPYVISVSSAPQEIAPAGSCIVHIVDLAAHAAISKEAASETFGLSDREADLAVELTRATSLKDAAAQACMALNTARNHMQSIFAKCRVHSQLELSRILARLT